METYQNRMQQQNRNEVIHLSFYSTITELIESIDEEEITYRNLHTNAYIKNGNDTIKIPYKSLISDYMPFLKETAIPATFTDDEKEMYRYKPKMLSNDLYDTTELWSALLELNNMTSVLDFQTENILVFDPDEMKEMLNEAMILEGILE